MNEDELREALIDLIKNDHDLAIELIESINSYDGSFEEMEMFAFNDEFFETFFDNPADAARATQFGEIQSWNDEYIGFNGYGNLISKSRYEYGADCADMADEIADWLIDNGTNHINADLEIEELFDRYYNDDDDDDEESYNRRPKAAVKKTPAKKSPSKKPAKKVVSKSKAKKPAVKKAPAKKPVAKPKKTVKR